MIAESKNRTPYPGPRPFEREESGIFFGREREVRELLSLVTAHRAVLLYAQSGAGKTSLLNAGLIPLLTKQGFEVLPVARVRGFEPEDIDLKEIPNIYVYNTLVGWAGDNVEPGSLVSTSIVTFLEEREPLMDEQGLPLPRVAIFDQFEELFTSYPGRWKEREDFFCQVVEALEADPLLRVLFVIREDYLASLDSYIDLLPERLRTRCRLERLRAEAACQAVERPIRDTGRKFAEGVASRLVNKLLNIRVENAAGEIVETPGQYVEPVQLQIVCQSLWQNLPEEVTVIVDDHLERFGDVQEALRSFYERAIETAKRQTGVSEGDLRAWFNDKLITPAGTRGTVFQGKEQTEGITNSAVDVLEAQHIIRAERRAGARWYELTHDRLIEPIRKSNEEFKRAEEQRRAKAKVRARVVKCFVALIAICVGTSVVLILFKIFFYHRLTIEAVNGYVKVIAVDGSAVKNPNQASFRHRAVVILEAVADPNFRFKKWSGDPSGGADTTTLIMDGDKLVTAKFVALDTNDVETNSIGMKLVYIQHGSFMMGSGQSDAQLVKEFDPVESYVEPQFPQHRVSISKGFWMGQTEVTQGQYESVMNDRPWSGQKWVEPDPNNPAVYVNWKNAVDFCTKLSQREGATYRLPTEAEWEYACRAGTTTQFSFGDDDSSLGDYAWYKSNAYDVGQRYAHSVGQKRPNPWGLYDMHGNVFEWCSDWYDKDYYSKSPSVDPKGPPTSNYLSYRGGSWTNVAFHLRCSARNFGVSWDNLYHVGFRVVRQHKTFYRLIATAVHGSITKVPDQARYEHGEEVTLVAVPNKGYRFANWSGDLSGSTNPATLIMDANKSVTASFVLGSVVTPPGFYIHRNCVEFRDQENVISKGPITRVKVFYSGYIHGLQIYYGGYGGQVFGFGEFKDNGVKLDVGEFVVPAGQLIVRVEGKSAKNDSGFLYVSRLQFITDKGTRSPCFGGKQGTSFEAADKNGLPLRTISGWVNLRRHPSLNRAITSMTFHFGY